MYLCHQWTTLFDLNSIAQFGHKGSLLLPLSMLAPKVWIGVRCKIICEVLFVRCPRYCRNM